MHAIYFLPLYVSSSLFPSGNYVYYILYHTWCLYNHHAYSMLTTHVLYYIVYGLSLSLAVLNTRLFTPLLIALKVSS